MLSATVQPEKFRRWSCAIASQDIIRHRHGRLATTERWKAFRPRGERTAAVLCDRAVQQAHRFAVRHENATLEALRPLPLTSLFWRAVRPEVLPKLGGRRDRDGYGLPWAKAALRIRSKPSPDRTSCRTCDAHAAEAVRVRRPYGCRPNAPAPSLPDRDRGPSGSGCTRAVWATPGRVCGARRPAGPAFFISPQAGDG